MLNYEEAKQYIGKYVRIHSKYGRIIEGFLSLFDDKEDEDDAESDPLFWIDISDEDIFLSEIKTIEIVPIPDLYSFALDETGLDKVSDTKYSYGGDIGDNYFLPSDFPLKLHEAIQFSQKKYDGETIKGLDTPVSIFLMEVLAVICGEKPSIQLAIASVLQGLLNRPDSSGVQLEVKFGSDVSRIVFEIEDIFQDNDNLPWQKRSKIIIDNVKNASFEARSIILADFVCACRSIVFNEDTVGDAVWDNFDISKEEIALFLSELIDSYDDFQYIEDAHNEYWELNSLFKHLFVNYYYLKEKDYEAIYQVFYDNISIRRKNDSNWTAVDTINNRATSISKLSAELLEDQWDGETEEENDGSEDTYNVLN